MGYLVLWTPKTHVLASHLKKNAPRRYTILCSEKNPERFFVRSFWRPRAACAGETQAVQIQAVADHGEFPAQESCNELFTAYGSLSGILFSFLFERTACFLNMLLLQRTHFGINESQMALEFVFVIVSGKIHLGAVYVTAKALRYV